MTKLFTSIIVLMLSLFSLGQLPYNEDFSSYADPSGVNSTGNNGDYPATTGWSIDISGATLSATDDYGWASGGSFVVKDSDGDLIWTSPGIAITGCTGVNFSLDLAETGTMEADDYIHVEYSTDGGATFTGINNWLGLGDATHTVADDFNSTTVTGGPLTGTTLIFRITFNCNAGTESLFLDNISVTGSCSSNTITTSNLTGDDYSINCSTSTGANGTIDFTSTGTFNVGNEFYVEMSDANGSFINSDTIAVLNGAAAEGVDPSGTIGFTIPPDYEPGTGYIIRVISTNPVTYGNETSSFSIIQLAPCTITAGAISGGPFSIDCSTPSTDSGSILYTAGGSYNPGNTFTVELSNSSGSFTNPTVIGSLTTTSTSGSINFTIPSNLPSGSGYLIRIVSDDPILTGDPSSSFTITQNSGCTPPHITSVIVDSCQDVCSEGHNEIVFGTTGDYEIEVTPSNFQMNYGTTSTILTDNYTETLTTNATTTAVLNDSAGCPGLFVEGTSETLPPDASFMLVRSTICPAALDWSSLCGAGPIYVIYTTDGTWGTSGNFKNDGGGIDGDRYFETNITDTDGNTYTVNSEYNVETLTLGSDGDYVTFDESGGTPQEYGNNGCSIDPIVLNSSVMYFEGSSRDSKIDLFWSSTSQINTDYFIIEHSMDGINWTEIGTENGHGTTDEFHSYFMQHYRPENGINYYMLYSVDYNGHVFRKKMTSVDVSNDNAFYNSGNKTIYLHEKASIELYSLDGKLILKRTDCDEIPFDKKGVFILKDVKTAKTQRIFTY